MGFSFLVLSALCVLAFAIPASNEEQEEAVRSLLLRILPKSVAVEFTVRVRESEVSGWSMRQGLNGSVLVEGDSGVSVCAGIYHYLRGNNCSFTWGGNKLDISAPIPSVLAPVSRTRMGPWSYYFNVVTSGYSTVWWSWEVRCSFVV